MGIFDSKNFNSDVFTKYLETVPRVKQNAFLKAGILRNRGDLKNSLVDQVGGNFISVPMTGLIGGTALNYDGATNITSTGLETFLQNMIVVGRSKAWKEYDFTADIAGKDFMGEIAKQVSNYWDDVDQATILATLKGIFGVSTDNFSTNHTLDISAETNAYVDATTLNTAVQKAAGANKNLYTLAIMHSVVATNLENLQVLNYFKANDDKGMQRDVAMATWNGRTVLIDDDVPVDTSGDSPKYTTYILGQNAFDYVDAGAKVPTETWRDPHTAGGYEELITRQRKVFAPKGFSFVMPTPAVVSPVNSELETADNWTVVTNTAGTGYFDSKAIPFARIISLG